MSEAIISRRGYGQEGKPKKLTQEVIVVNTAYKVPNGVNMLSVRIFGGGGGGGFGGGGGGGWMNNGDIGVYEGQIINITIGKGGYGDINQIVGNGGGTTTFGTYLSANGGSGGTSLDGGDGGAGGGGGFGNGGNGHQFGGGGATNLNSFTSNPIICRGGNGGIWGGGGGTSIGGSGTMSTAITYQAYGGNGGMYGGGGGSFAMSLYNHYTTGSPLAGYAYAYGGNGGTYGGGGGAVAGARSASISQYGHGGTYGGDGGNAIINITKYNDWPNQSNVMSSVTPAKNGINTIGVEGILSIDNMILEGNGTCGNIPGCGGGGYGGSTNINYFDNFTNNKLHVLIFCTGGGGYGGNINQASLGTSYMRGSGGCGYGSSGGVSDGGGGGGYGPGADGGSSRGGGGGYFSKGGNNYGGGASYGDGASSESDPGYGGGGASWITGNGRYHMNGGNGVCIIQYYA